MGSHSGSQSACRPPISLPLRQIILAVRHDPYLQTIVDFGLKGYLHGR